jgi:maltose alpha-D-glucosyltransferase/alpha-amylase
MQWSPDRNAGFSRADFAQLYLPPLMDPVYGFQAVNVEAQTRNPSSQLHWMRRMLEVRRQHPVFGTGSLEVVSTDNPSVLAYIRASASEEHDPQPPGVAKPAPAKASHPAPGPASPSQASPGQATPSQVKPSQVKPSPDGTSAPGDVVLCVSNLSRFAQPAQLPLHRWEGMTPIELLGRTPFPPIGELPYFVTLPPYGFYWFGLVAGAPSPPGD